MCLDDAPGLAAIWNDDRRTLSSDCMDQPWSELYRPLKETGFLEKLMLYYLLISMC